MSGIKRVPREEFFENLREIVRTAHQHNVQPILLLPPVAALDIYFDGAISNFHRLHELYQNEVVRASQYEEAPLVDLQKAFDKHSALFDNPEGDPIHFNEAGHIVVAQAVAEVAAPLIDPQ
jgi:lysophospholipase L1-like esterase